MNRPRPGEKLCAQCDQPWRPGIDLDGVGYPVPTSTGGVRLQQVHGRCEEAFAQRVAGPPTIVPEIALQVELEALRLA
jgi:hypothetical protein